MQAQAAAPGAGAEGKEPTPKARKGPPPPPPKRPQRRPLRASTVGGEAMSPTTHSPNGTPKFRTKAEEEWYRHYGSVPSAETPGRSDAVANEGMATTYPGAEEKRLPPHSRGKQVSSRMERKRGPRPLTLGMAHTTGGPRGPPFSPGGPRGQPRPYLPGATYPQTRPRPHPRSPGGPRGPAPSPHSVMSGSAGSVHSFGSPHARSPRGRPHAHFARGPRGPHQRIVFRKLQTARPLQGRPVLFRHGTTTRVIPGPGMNFSPRGPRGARTHPGGPLFNFTPTQAHAQARPGFRPPKPSQPPPPHIVEKARLARLRGLTYIAGNIHKFRPGRAAAVSQESGLASSGSAPQLLKSLGEAAAEEAAAGGLEGTAPAPDLAQVAAAATPGAAEAPAVMQSSLPTQESAMHDTAQFTPDLTQQYIAHPSMSLDSSDGFTQTLKKSVTLDNAALNDTMTHSMSAVLDEPRVFGDWAQHWDDEAQAYYWYNHATEEASWIAPDGLEGEEFAHVEGAAAAEETVWEKYWDEVEETWYYINMGTGETFYGDENGPILDIPTSPFEGPDLQHHLDALQEEVDVTGADGAGTQAAVLEGEDDSLNMLQQSVETNMAAAAQVSAITLAETGAGGGAVDTPPPLSACSRPGSAAANAAVAVLGGMQAAAT